MAVVRQLKEARVPPEKDCSGEVIKIASWGRGESLGGVAGVGGGDWGWLRGSLLNIGVSESRKTSFALAKFSNYCQPLGNLVTSLFNVSFSKAFQGSFVFLHFYINN